LNKVFNEFLQAVEKFEIKSEALEDEEIVNRIQQYCILLWHKNQSLNLTRHTDWDTFVSRDLIDTLELSMLIPQDKQVLDVGSGGGVPGLLLAILRPDLDVCLTESVGKKTAVLGEFAEALNVPCQIYQERAENILADFRFDFTTARAVGSLSKLCIWFEEVWLNAGSLLAIKGPNWVNEEKEATEAGLTNRIDIKSLVEYQPPGCEWTSVILKITPKVER